MLALKIALPVEREDDRLMLELVAGYVAIIVYKTVGIQLFYLGRKELAEQFVIALEHFLIDFRREFLVESPIFQGFQYFIIATPHRQGSMIAKTANIVAGFCFSSLL